MDPAGGRIRRSDGGVAAWPYVDDAALVGGWHDCSSRRRVVDGNHLCAALGPGRRVEPLLRRSVPAHRPGDHSRGPGPTYPYGFDLGYAIFDYAGKYGVREHERGRWEDLRRERNDWPREEESADGS